MYMCKAVCSIKPLLLLCSSCFDVCLLQCFKTYVLSPASHLARGWGCDALTVMGEAPPPGLPSIATTSDRLLPSYLFAPVALPHSFGTAYWCCVRLFVCCPRSLFEGFTRLALSLLADRVTSLSPAIETAIISRCLHFRIHLSSGAIAASA
jgi:hypothetical protein